MKIKVLVSYLVNWYFNNFVAQVLVALISVFSIIFYVMESYMVIDSNITYQYVVIGDVSEFFIIVKTSN